MPTTSTRFPAMPAEWRGVDARGGINTRCWRCLRVPSVRSTSVEHSRKRLPQHHEVHHYRPVLDVEQVKPHRFLPREFGAATDLPEPGHPRLEQHPPARVVAVLFHLAWQGRPRTDQGHLPAQHVPELRQLVQRMAPYSAPRRRHPRVLADLEEHPVGVMEVPEVVLFLLGADSHGPEFPHPESLAMDADTFLPVEHRSSTAQLDQS